jgi:hypothetical protein
MTLLTVNLFDCFDQGLFHYYTIDSSSVHSANATLKVSLERVKGSSDLYLGYNMFPNLTHHTAASYHNSQSDVTTLDVARVNQGQYIVGVFGYCCELHSEYRLHYCFEDVDAGGSSACSCK